MGDYKKIIVYRAGGTAKIDTDIIPGETTDQLIPLAARDLGYDENGQFQLIGPDGNPIKGDLFPQLKEGDKVTLAPQNTGG